MKKERGAPLDIRLSALLPRMRVRREVPNGEQLNAKCSFSLADFSASEAYPPTTPTPWGETSRNLHQIRRWHIKNHVTKKAVMVAKDVAAVLVFHWAPCIAPLSVGVVWYQRGTHTHTLSGLPCRSGIWSWWLCDSLGWGIAVSAEQETLSWSMGVFRQASVQRSYGMVPLRRSQSSLFHFSLHNNHSSPFLHFLKAQDDNIHTRQTACCPHTIFYSTIRSVKDSFDGD